MNTTNSLTYFYYKNLQVKKDEKIDYAKLFPEFFNFNSQKAKILFISPRLDENGYYQHILPALYLSKKGKYVSSCITNINKSKQELDCTTAKFIIPKMLIQQADIVVFPFVNQDLEPAYRAIRGINPKAKIIYTIDYDFYNVPSNHSRKQLFTKDEDLLVIEKNIYYSDKTIVPNFELLTTFNKKMNNKFEHQKSLSFEKIPFYITPENYKGIDFSLEPQVKKTDKVRIGIISYWHNQEDIEMIKPLLKWINKKYKDKVEVVFWGTDPHGLEGESNSDSSEDGELKEVKNNQINELKEKFGKVDLIEYRRFKKDSYIYNYKDLYNLGLDCLLSIRKNNDWNKNNRRAQEMIDASYYSIPIIANHRFTELPDDFYSFAENEKELKEAITKFLDHKDLARQMAESSKDYVLSNLAYTEDKWDELENIFLSFSNEPTMNDEASAG